MSSSSRRRSTEKFDLEAHENLSIAADLVFKRCPPPTPAKEHKGKAILVVSKDDLDSDGEMPWCCGFVCNEHTIGEDALVLLRRNSPGHPSIVYKWEMFGERDCLIPLGSHVVPNWFNALWCWFPNAVADELELNRP